MSHLTRIRTNFQNLFYLEKALKRLEIPHKRQQILPNYLDGINLVIPQSNGYDITFSWNGKEYELLVDKSFWKQSCSIQNFTNKILQYYASEVIIGEGRKTNFQPINYQTNEDGSKTLVLERFYVV